MNNPSPFIEYNEADKSFKAAGDNPCWRSHCFEKFNWIKRLVLNGLDPLTPSDLALIAD